MGIIADDVQRIRDETDIVALISNHVALRRVGRNHVGLCPFHAEKTASFSVRPELGRWYCFGCQARGDAIDFVRQVEHVDFVTAVERLASRAGITLRYDSVSASREHQRRDRLVAAAAAAADFYHQRLLGSRDAGPARSYLRGRGFEGDAVRQFQLGWAPDAYDELSVALQQQGFARQDLIDAGLAFVNRANKLQDQFRRRIIFPIADTRGDAVGFGGRALGDESPKYKNSPESALYQKSRVLYGLHWAKAGIVANGEVVVCEGYTDVMAFFLAGVPRAVATCGTALAEDHFRMLKNFARTVVLAYDADAAGQAAAERFYEWESRYEVRLKVADLPAGRDPADVWRASEGALATAVDHARPFLEFRLERLFAAGDLTSAEGVADVVEAAMALIATHPNEIVRDQYTAQVAVRLNLDPERLARRPARSRPNGADPARRDAPPVARVPMPEVEALRIAVHEPELIAGRLLGPLFGDRIARSAFDALAASATFHDALDAAGEARPLLERLAVEEPHWDVDRDIHATAVVVRLVERAARAVVTAMADADNDDAVEVKRLLDTLASAQTAGDWVAADAAAGQLVPWIAHSAEV